MNYPLKKNLIGLLSLMPKFMLDINKIIPEFIKSARKIFNIFDAIYWFSNLYFSNFVKIVKIILIKTLTATRAMLAATGNIFTVL